MSLPLYKELLRKLEELSQFSSCLNILQWDQEVFMPRKGEDPRAKLIGTFSVILHEKLLQLDTKGSLKKLTTWTADRPKSDEAIIVRETVRSYRREKKLPAAFVQELSELTSKAQSVWAQARAKEDFSLFLPSLKRIIELKRKEAELVSYKESPYDALLDTYEPGLTSAQVSQVFTELRDFLKPFIQTLQEKKRATPDPKITHGTFPIAEQEAFNRWVAERMGFDFEAGRLDRSTHPFSSGFHPLDVRLTTRYDEHDVLYALGSTIHETGHGLYEQGLPLKYTGTPLGESVSYSIHESQSRIWENTIGKSRAFLQAIYPELQSRFPKPFAKIPLETMYQLVNRVTPSFIRTESDEVTYNLHIIVRYELERDLMEGQLKAKDLPEAWNAKMKDYLGVTVKNDREGVLQDVHWSAGLFGYFPTYALGNLYAAQFYQALRTQVPTAEKALQKGNCSPTRDWLRTNIHAHGKRYTSAELIKKVTGKPLSAQFFIDYLNTKYGELYGL